jgi:phosphinothricin acetyltransferase
VRSFEFNGEHKDAQMPRIRDYASKDWPQVEQIYREGIETELATFETSPKSRETWESDSVPGTSIVAINAADQIAGWAVLWPVSDRCAYAGVAEVSVYIAASARGQGVGKALLNELVSVSERNGIWTLQAGIFAENQASISLHEKCGFRLIGVRERLGALHGVWKDIALMERRSGVIGK